MIGVGADVLENERACCRHDQDLQHEVVQRLKKYLAEGFCFDRRAIVVSEERSSLWKVFPCETLGHVHFKLVTDALDSCTTKDQI